MAKKAGRFLFDILLGVILTVAISPGQSTWLRIAAGVVFIVLLAIGLVRGWVFDPDS